MALTAAQMTNTRRWMGYALTGTSMPITDDQDLVYGQFGLVTMSLHKRLTTLDASEEVVLVDTYLTNLATLESAVAGASDNLDTAKASVWEWNRNEVADRTGLFNKWRREMCAFLGFPPGPGLRANNCVVRG